MYENNTVPKPKLNLLTYLNIWNEVYTALRYVTPLDQYEHEATLIAYLVP